MASRADNRQMIMKLFQAYHRDFGPDALKIIKVLVDDLGGLRLLVPTRSTRRHRDNWKAVAALYWRMCDTFGDASGKAIVRTFLSELGGCRVSFPTHRDLWREERNRRIRSLYNGSNVRELSIMFGLSHGQIRRIL